MGSYLLEPQHRVGAQLMSVVGEGEKKARVTSVHLPFHSTQDADRRKCHGNARHRYVSQPARQCHFNVCSPSLVSPAGLCRALLLGQWRVGIAPTLSSYAVLSGLRQGSTPEYLLKTLATGRAKLEEK